MSQLSFAHIPSIGFSGFSTTLESAPWTLIDASAYANPSTPLWDAPLLVTSKVRLGRCTGALFAAMSGAGGAKACDEAWDASQNQLSFQLHGYAVSKDPAKRDAAKRLQTSLLLGRGKGQTQLRYQAEVDFGRNQQLAVAAGQGAADVALLGLGELMHEIAVATEALAAAIAHGETGVTPHQRRIQATSACAKTFGWAAESLLWLIEEGGNGAERETAVACLATLRELTLRYPAMKRANPPAESTIAAPPASVH